MTEKMTALEALDAIPWGTKFEDVSDYISYGPEFWLESAMAQTLLTLDRRFIRNSTGWTKLTQYQHHCNQMCRMRAKFHILMTNPHALDN